MKKLLSIFIMLLLILSLANFAFAEVPDYSKSTVIFICPWDAGGSSDATTRQIAELFAKETRAKTAVENRGGAGGTVATTEFKSAKPDGLTICQEAIGVFTLQPFVREVNYSIDDFIPVVALSQEPILLLANQQSGIKNIDDLKSKGSILYGFSGSGSLMELSQKKLFADMQLDAIGLPYDGSSSTIAALLGNHVDVCTIHPGEALQYIENGEMIPLGIFNAERDTRDIIKEIPTFKELGYDINMSVWKFMMVPKGTSQETVDYLYSTLSKCTSSKQYLEFCKNTNLLSISMSPNEIVAQVKAEAEVNKALLK